MNAKPGDQLFDGFLELAVRSGRLTPEKVERLLRGYRQEFLPTTQLPDTLMALCSYAVSVGALTAWQCSKLRDGRWKGFFLDGFVLKDRVSLPDEPLKYLARRMSDKGYVLLEIASPTDSASEMPKYRIVYEY